MVTNRSILAHQPKVMLYGGRVDQAVGRISWEGRWKRNGSVGDRGAYCDGSQLLGETLKPRPNWNVDDDPLMLCQPSQLIP